MGWHRNSGIDQDHLSVTAAALLVERKFRTRNRDLVEEVADELFSLFRCGPGTSTFSSAATYENLHSVEDSVS